MPLKFPALVFCLASAWTILACGSKPGSKGSFHVNLDDTLAVRIRLPSGYDSTRTYPILIGLHGRGSSAGGFLDLWDTISGRDILYIVPEGPFPFAQGSTLLRKLTHDSLRIAPDRARSEQYVAETLTGAEGSKAFIAHGIEDDIISFGKGESAHQNLKNLGCRVEFRKTPGGHWVDGESLALALDWMFPGPVR